MRKQIVRSAQVPAPVGGINARDSIAGQKPEDAVHMSNWWPTAFDVQVRKGYTRHLTAAPLPRHMMSYNTNGGTDKLFFGAGAAIYDGTTAGTTGTAVVTGLSGSSFYGINFSTSAGTYLFVVNGVDSARHYNGTTWATPTITGVTSDNFTQGTVHKDRLWFIIKNSLTAAYLGSKSIAGAAAAFDMRSMCKQGGYLVACTTWTLDAGEGMDDHLVFITSEGECLVYRGTDPSDAALWSIVGVWQLSKPVGRRCFTKMGGDVVYFGRQGATLLSKALASSQVSSGNTLSDRIKPLISADWEKYGGFAGWEVFLYPQESMLILSVPESATKSHQWVMNTITGAWTRFDGVNAMSFALFDDALYFATNGETTDEGQVCKFWEGYLDSPYGLEKTIQADALQSFQTFGNGTANKWFTMVRPNMVSGGIPGLFYQVNGDYDPSPPTYTPTYNAASGQATWGNANWGAFRWAGGRYQLTDWQHAGVIGRSAGLWLRVVARDIETRWSATDYMYEPGGMI